MVQHCAHFNHVPSLTLSHKMIAQDGKMSDLRSQLISHKLILTNLIKVKESEVRNLVEATKQHLKSEGLLEKPGRTHLDTILESKRTRISSKCSGNYLSIRRGICCFENEAYTCDKPSLPFSRHCRRHILYNVDQLLFVRCTAKDSDTLTQCNNPSLDIMRDEPLCNHHWQVKNRAKLKSEGDLEDQQHQANLGKGKGRNKLASGAGRPGRRSKKRRRMTGKGASGSIDSIDGASFLSQDSSDIPFINSTSENNCDSTQDHHPPAIKINSNDITSLTQVRGNQVCISSPTNGVPSSSILHPIPSAFPEQNVFGALPMISTTTASTTVNTSTPPTLLTRNPLIPQPTSLPPAPVIVPENNQPNGVIPGSLDVGVSTLAPSDEALVASLVAELPPLCTGNGPEPEPPSVVDADLTDVLNKIPDDAFNDLFVDNLKNGDIPSKEESEALEQALATVSKNVHILSVAAAVVGSRTGTSPIPRATGGTVINGDSNYYSHVPQHHHHHHHNHQQTQHHTHHHHHHTVNGQTSASSPLPSHDVQGRLNSSGPVLNLNENDILGLANNILTSLTDEQQQQLNGLIDGALASGTLTSSPTLKSALASLSNLAQEGEPCETHL